jgi:drug/metabolite transporter (DMT)-like permease
MRARSLAYVLLLIAILIWGFAYVVTKSGLDAVPPMMFALLRYAVASLLLVPVALARGGLARLPQPVPWRTLILMAIVGVTLYYVLFNLALAYTSASPDSVSRGSASRSRASH